MLNDAPSSASGESRALALTPTISENRSPEIRSPRAMSSIQAQHQYLLRLVCKGQRHENEREECRWNECQWLYKYRKQYKTYFFSMMQEKRRCTVYDSRHYGLDCVVEEVPHISQNAPSYSIGPCSLRKCLRTLANGACPKC